MFENVSVCGAHYDSEERPPGVAVYQTGSGGGWVAPQTNSVMDLTDTEITDIIHQVNSQQREPKKQHKHQQASECSSFNF